MNDRHQNQNRQNRGQTTDLEPGTNRKSVVCPRFPLWFILLTALATTAMAQEKTYPSAAAAAKMRESAERFLGALPEGVGDLRGGGLPLGGASADAAVILRRLLHGRAGTVPRRGSAGDQPGRRRCMGADDPERQSANGSIRTERSRDRRQ